MRVFVTGASGYLGGELVRRLVAAGHDVVAPSLRDACWPPALQGVDVVAHLAGVKELTADPGSLRMMIESNCSLTQRLLDAARAAGVERIVFTSSYRVYGRQAAQELPCDEDAEARPLDAYGMSKLLAEELIRRSRLSHAIVRLPNVFGMGEAGVVSQDVVWAMTASALQEDVIRVQGAGSQTLDLLPLGEACSLLQRAIERLTTERLTLNAGRGEAVAVSALARLIAETVHERSGRQIAVQHVPEQSPACSRAIAVERLREWLGPMPQQRLADALRAAVAAQERAMAAAR